MRKPPTIRYSPLTGRIFCVTRYVRKGATLHAQEKFDVTEEVLEAAREARSVRRTRKSA